MYKPGGQITVVGGDLTLNPEQSLVGQSGSPHGRKGVFAANPAMTPKYHTNNNEASLGFMARMFIPFTDAKTRDAFTNSFSDSDTKTLAQALAVDSGSNSGFGYGYIDFLLQRANEPQQEKFQVVDVLSDNYVSYFYGRQPPMFQYSGVLLNTVQDDWRMAFHLMYQQLLRGTKMARHKTVVTLAYDDIFVTGVLISMSQSLGADMEMAVPFDFQLLVKQLDLHTRYWGTQGYNPTKLGSWGYDHSVTSKIASNVSIVPGAKSIEMTVPGARMTVSSPTKENDKVGDPELAELDAPRAINETEYNASKSPAHVTIKQGVADLRLQFTTHYSMADFNDWLFNEQKDY